MRFRPEAAPRALVASLALALALAGPAAAYDPAMVPEPPPPGRYRVGIQEGGAWGKAHLYLRLYPPSTGRYATVPFTAGIRSGAGIAAFEVAPARHAPRLPTPGYADLGPIPPDGTYAIRLSAADAGEAEFELVLAPDLLTLRKTAGPPSLTLAAERMVRLPPGSFAYRFDPPQGCSNPMWIRSRWLAALLALDGVVPRRKPSGPLSDVELGDLLESGAELFEARDPAAVRALATRMANEGPLGLMLRFTGGETFYTRGCGPEPDPHWARTLEFLVPKRWHRAEDGPPN